MSSAELLLTDRKADQEEFRRQILAGVDAVLKAMNTSKAYAGMLPRDLERFLHEEVLLPEHGLGFDEVLRRTEEKILPNMLHPSSQTYMAHLHSPVLLESIVAELIIAVFNQSMDSWDQSPAATEIEVDTIRHLCRLYGFGEEADGVFTSGGSQSNLTALLLARDRFCREKLTWDVQKHGLPEQYRKLRLYTSEISHFSMEKSAHLLGLGYEAVVKVPVDAAQKMDVGELTRLVERMFVAAIFPSASWRRKEQRITEALIRFRPFARSVTASGCFCMRMRPMEAESFFPESMPAEWRGFRSVTR